MKNTVENDLILFVKLPSSPLNAPQPSLFSAQVLSERDLRKSDSERERERSVGSLTSLSPLSQWARSTSSGRWTKKAPGRASFVPPPMKKRRVCEREREGRSRNVARKGRKREQRDLPPSLCGGFRRLWEERVGAFSLPLLAGTLSRTLSFPPPLARPVKTSSSSSTHTLSNFHLSCADARV